MRRIILAAILAIAPGCSLFQHDPQPAVEAIDMLDRISADRLAAEMRLVDEITDPAAQAEFRAFFTGQSVKAAEIRGEVLDYLLAIGEVDAVALYLRFRDRSQQLGGDK